MTPPELIRALRERNVEVSVVDGSLRLKGDRAALQDAQLLATVRDNKAALLLALAEQAATASGGPIPKGCNAISPDMLDLVRLNPTELDRIVGVVAGGAANVQDIYPLAPLQEGILFHHMLAKRGDPYVMRCLLEFDSRERLENYVRALQFVIDRHDSLRTGVLWEGLTEPVQVVWRRAAISIEEVSVDPTSDVAEQLLAHGNPRHFRLDLSRPPLKRLFAARLDDKRWLAVELTHHLSGDHTTLEVMQREMHAYLSGHAAELPPPVPFREFVSRARSVRERAQQEAFFTKLLGDVAQPTLPFELKDTYGDGDAVNEATLDLTPRLAARLRACAHALGVSAAALHHVAWALVLARCVGMPDVVFGTVLFGRMHGSAGVDRALGLFMNTLPVRVRLTDDTSVQECVRSTQRLLLELLRYEHASLTLAQRCSGVRAPTPLFAAVLNYRHDEAANHDEDVSLEGVRLLRAEERSNYPLVMHIDDSQVGFTLNVQVASPLDPQRICSFMAKGLTELVTALETNPSAPARGLDVMPDSERGLLLSLSEPATLPEREACVHDLFEAQAQLTPNAVALVCDGQRITYGELDARANRLANYLRARGVGPEALVGVCLERSPAMLIALLAILKAGGAYVPLDPSYPAARLGYMLADAKARLVCTQASLQHLVPLAEGLVVALDRDAAQIASSPVELTPAQQPVTPRNLAYVIYTSGSTGRPKGVAVEHASVAALMVWAKAQFRTSDWRGVLASTSISFDLSVFELFATLGAGGTVHLARNALDLPQVPTAHEVTLINMVPSALKELLNAGQIPRSVRVINSGGEALSSALAEQLYTLDHVEQVNDLYGPTEDTVYSMYSLRGRGPGSPATIGRPIPGTQTYILDAQRRLVPMGLVGELYLGGRGLARGYYGRPELTRERFVDHPFQAGGRLYRTGDLARYLPGGDIEYLGRADTQVKVRGYRIELEEVEARLRECPGVADAVVVTRQDGSGIAHLVAYYTVASSDPPPSASA